MVDCKSIGILLSSQTMASRLEGKNVIAINEEVFTCRVIDVAVSGDWETVDIARKNWEQSNSCVGDQSDASGYMRFRYSFSEIDSIYEGDLY